MDALALKQTKRNAWFAKIDKKGIDSHPKEQKYGPEKQPRFARQTTGV